MKLLQNRCISIEKLFSKSFQRLLNRLKKLSLSFSPYRKKVRGKITCNQCGKHWLLVSQYVIGGSEQRKLNRIIKYNENFHCGMDISDCFTEQMKTKNLAVEPRQCTDPISALYYRCDKYLEVCAWCTKALTKDEIQKLTKLSGDRLYCSNYVMRREDKKGSNTFFVLGYDIHM